ncbi:MAG: hypothetical protein ACOCSE_02435 [Chitinivibrionales bacterium]
MTCLKGSDSMGKPVLREISTSAVLFCLSLLLSGSYGNPNYENQDSVFKEIKNMYFRKYAECTKDTSAHTIEEILAWKEKTERITESPEYLKILEEFVFHTGITSGFLPCEVINWHESRKAQLDNKEDSLKRAISEYNSGFLDSVEMRQELSENPESEFDFQSIPFGLSRDVLKRVVSLRVKYPVMTTDTSLILEHYFIKSIPFSIEFITGKEGVFKSYTVSGYPHSVSHLDSLNRAEAELMKEVLFKGISTEADRFMVGRFDIDSTGITPVYIWEAGPHTCVTGYIERGHKIVTTTRVRYHPDKENN